jgi:peptidoglycan-N-acetylglucosamine deacetylase
MLKKVARKLINGSSMLIKSMLVPLLGTITNVETSEALVALTFDDGPDPVFTPQLLNILKKYDAHATFFMVGKNAEKYPELVCRIAQEGHAIGNHSWDHPSFSLIQGRERRRQIRACQKAIAPYGKRLFRPPYGNQSLISRLDVLLIGYKVITWNLIAIDWLDHSGAVMANRLKEKIQNGSIILFHDSLYHMVEERYTDRKSTLIAVEMLLKTLGGRFQFVSVSELLRYGRPQKEYWFKKPNIDYLNKLKGQFETPRLYLSK